MFPLIVLRERSERCSFMKELTYPLLLEELFVGLAEVDEGAWLELELVEVVLWGFAPYTVK